MYEIYYLCIRLLLHRAQGIAIDPAPTPQIHTLLYSGKEKADIEELLLKEGG